MFRKKIDYNYLHSVKWGGAAIGTSFLRLMLLVPAFLSVAGNNGYALWLVLFNGANLIAALSTGFLHYSSNLVNMSYHTSTNMKGLVSNIVKTAAWVAVFQLLIGVVVSVPALLSFFMNFDEGYLDSNHASLSILLLLVARLSYQYVSSFLLRLFEPLGRIRDTLKFQFFADLADFCATGLAIILSGSIFITCISVFVMSILVLIACAVYVKKNVAFFSFSISDGGSSQVTFFKKAGIFNVSFLIEKFYDNGINLVVQIFFGAGGTTLFNTCRSIGNVFYRLTYSIVLPLFPSIQKEYGMGNFGRIATTARRYWSVSTIVIMCGMLCGLPLLPVFYHYWTRGELVFDVTLIVLLFIGVLFQNFIFIISEFFKKTNLSAELLSFNIIKVVVTVLSIWLFSIPGYTWGIGAGIALAEIFGALYALWVFRKKVFLIRGANIYLLQNLVFSGLLMNYAITKNYLLLLLPGAVLALIVLYTNKIKPIHDLD